MRLCRCGCGQRIEEKSKWGYIPQYINHHHGKGRKATEETKKKIAEQAKKRTSEKNSFYGRHHSKETKKKISLANTGCKGWNKGIPMSMEARKKLSKNRKRGLKISKALKGRKITWGRKISETKKEMFKDHPERKLRMKEIRLNQTFPQKDSSIEVKFQNILEKEKIHYEKHKIIEKFTQCDIFIEPNIVIFLDGCHWHTCQICFPDRAKYTIYQNKSIIRDTLVNQFFSIRPQYKVLR